MKQKETEQKQKKNFLSDFFVFFKPKREMIKNNFKNNGKHNGFFPQMFLTPRDQKQIIEFFQRFFSKKENNSFLISDTKKMEK